jgi:hypothetical protein
LNYAPATLTPLRLRHLALGAAAITLGASIDFAFPYTLAFLPSYRAYEIAVLLTTLSNDLMILAGILLLAAAAPHAGAWITRWQTITCASLAGTLLLLFAVFAAYVLTTGDLAVTPGNVAYQLARAMDCMSGLLKLALLLIAGIYLNFVAAHLGRKPLGVLAACALAPCALDTLRDLAFNVLFLFEMTNQPAFTILQNLTPACFQYHLLWPIVAWGAIALSAAILARVRNAVRANA